MRVRTHALCLSAMLVAAATAGWTLTGRAAPMDEVLPLPKWSEEDVEILKDQPESLPLGGDLWPDGFDPTSILPPIPHLPGTPGEGELPTTPPPKNRRGIGENFLLFIPKPPPTEIQRALPLDKPLTEVTGEFLEQSELMQPDAFLLDPHMLLPETQSEDLRRLLAYHVSQSHTSAYFLLLDTHEKLSPQVDLSRLAGGKLTKNHACLAAFPLGQPWRARLFVTQEISRGVAPGYLPDILEACVKDAMRASDPVEQLQRFATQLSIRLIWLERAYPALFEDKTEVVRSAVHSETTAPAAYVLADVTQPDLAEDEGFLKWRKVLREHGTPITVAGVSLITLASLGLYLRRRTRRNQNRSMWLLPEVESKPRFGGPHCGSGGAWIKYG